MSFLSKRKIIAAFSLLVIVLAVFAVYKHLNQIEKKDMAEYVPDSAAAFLEVNSLSTLFSELLKTEAWQKLASSFGISKQIEYLTSASDILTFTGLAPAEANLLSVAQYALVLDNLELVTTEKEEGELEIVPKFALVIETHSRESKVEYLASKVSMFAKRIYSNKVVTKEENFNGIKIEIFQSENEDRKIISAQKGSVLIIGNSLSTVQNCLAVLLGKQISLKNNPSLKIARENISNDSVAFGFIKKETLSKILQLSTAFFPKLPTITNSKNQTIPSIISSQLIEGLAYSVTFKQGKVVEKYFALVKEEVIKSFSVSAKPSKNIKLTPELMAASLDFTVLLVNNPSEFLEGVITSVSVRTDAVISFALRQLVIELGKKYGISPDDPIGTLIGSEIALVKITQENEEEFISVLPVTDKLKILPTVGRYLRKGNEKLISKDYKGVEIVSNPEFESRAIAFLDGYLVLATEKRLMFFIDLWQKSKSKKVNQNNFDIAKNFPNAIFLSSKIEKNNVGNFFLSLSKLLRTTDGAKEILNDNNISYLIEDLPPAISIGQFIEKGLIIETHSTLGIFVYISMLFDNSNSDLQETQN